MHHPAQGSFFLLQERDKGDRFEAGSGDLSASHSL
jgi:hypothetical protein